MEAQGTASKIICRYMLVFMCLDVLNVNLSISNPHKSEDLAFITSPVTKFQLSGIILGHSHKLQPVSASPYGHV